MRTSSRLPIIAIIAIAFVAACTTAAASPSPSGAPSVSPEAQPSVSPPVSVAASASLDALTSPVATSTAFEPDTIVVTIVDSVRVRSAPTVDSSSATLEPLLPKATRLFVIAGPTSADGYDWYMVASLDGPLPDGWVARAARDGTPWVESDSEPCPTLPVETAALRQLTPYGGLACFGGNEIKVGGVVDCQVADVDRFVGGPDWLHYDRYCSIDIGGGQEMEIHDGGNNLRVPDHGDAILTGHFDDPQASSCTYGFEPPAPDPAVIVTLCRAMFVVTRFEGVDILTP